MKNNQEVYYSNVYKYHKRVNKHPIKHLERITGLKLNGIKNQHTNYTL